MQKPEARIEARGGALGWAVVPTDRGAVRINEWKRHQSAPGPKVSRRASVRQRRHPISNKYPD